jgi:hypothetical protein
MATAMFLDRGAADPPGAFPPLLDPASLLAEPVNALLEGSSEEEGLSSVTSEREATGDISSCWVASGHWEELAPFGAAALEDDMALFLTASDLMLNLFVFCIKQNLCLDVWKLVSHDVHELGHKKMERVGKRCKQLFGAKSSLYSYKSML